MRNVLLACLCLISFSNIAFSQSACEFRTPLRTMVANVAEAAPLRSAINSIRLSNWRAQSCGSGQFAQSCPGEVIQSYQSNVQTPAAIPYDKPFSYYQDVGTSYIEHQQQYASNSVAVASASVAGVVGDRVKARRVIVEAARSKLRSDEITLSQFLMIAGATRNPATLDKLMGSIHEAAIEDGIASTQAINWDALLAFIEKLIPIILQLIEMFG